MGSLVLYGHHDSGHAYKVALALAMAGIGYEYRWVDILAPPDDRPGDFRAFSKFDEIPVLIDDGVALVQSNAILLHLARRYRCLGGETETRYSQSREWLFWEANRIGFSLANLRHQVRFQKESPPEVIRWLRERFFADATRLDRELSGKAFLLGDAVSVADISCYGYLCLAGQAAVDLAAWPAILHWTASIRAQEGWQSPYDLLNKKTP